MAKMTDEAREILRAKFKDLADREAALFVERKPIDDKLVAIEEARDQLETEHATCIAGRCETCRRLLLEGDLGFRYDDSPEFCEAHAPTWNDIKRDQDDMIAGGLFEDSYDGEPGAAQGYRDLVLRHIAEGRGDERHVWEF